MSEPSTDMRLSRGKAWLHPTAGEAMGRPLAEWAYRTPRFPQDIKRSDLAEVTPEIRRETMIIWFLANHVPAKGPYFGFAEASPSQQAGALNTAALNTMPLNGSVEIGGFDEAPFFNGGCRADAKSASCG